MKKFMVAVCILISVFSVNLCDVFADAILDWYPEENYTDSYSTDSYVTDDYSAEHYAVDYYVQVSAPDGGVNFRYGPGVEYNKVFGNMIPNGEILHITETAAASNGNYWGYTFYDGQYGWVALSQVTPYIMPTAVPTPIPTAVPTATPTPMPTATSTPVPTATEAPLAIVTNTPTPVPTEEITPIPTVVPEVGTVVNFSFLIKLFSISCVVLLIVVTALILLWKKKK